MKKIHFLFGLATMVALSTMFMACSSDDEISQGQPKSNQLTLTSSVSMTRSVNTELQATQIASGVKVGAFVVQEGTPTATGNNNQLTADGSGNFTYATAMTWPASGSVSIYAYAPYNSAYTVDAANEFSVAADQSSDEGYIASDLIYGVPTANNPIAESQSTSGNVAMSFSHKLTKLVVTLVKNSGSEIDLKGATVSIINTLPSTTINPSTGAIGAASGTATVIKAVSFASTATEFKSAAVIIPQTIAANTNLVKIETTDGKTYQAKLATEVTFAAGKAYNYTITIGDAVALTTMTLNGGNVTNWDDDATVLASNADEVAAPVTYGIGDYLLADGTLVKAAAIGEQTPAAIIFSTTVSATDAAAGYGAYAMALKRYKNRTFVADADHTAMMSTGAGTWSQGLNDLDGLTHTTAMLASDYYAALSDDNKAASVINMSGFTPALSGTTNSGWYLPSFGQMVQIMNQFGQATIAESTVEDGDNIASGSAFYTSAAGALTTLVTNMQANVTKADEDLFAVGNIVYATSTENNSTSSSHLQKFWSIQCASGDTYAFGKNTGRGSNGRSVIPVTAVKLPTE